MARYIDTADCAKLIRAALKREFPGIKFSVRLSRYAGGSSIDVEWTDGPTGSQVDPVVHAYQGGRFDGMIDLAYSVESYLTPDGRAFLAKTPGTTGSMGVHEPAEQWMPEPGCERVRFSVSFVHTKRRHSAAMYRRALEAVARKWGVDIADVEIVETAWGAHLTRTGDRHIEAANTDLATLVYRDLVRRTNYLPRAA